MPTTRLPASCALDLGRPRDVALPLRLPPTPDNASFPPTPSLLQVYGEKQHLELLEAVANGTRAAAQALTAVQDAKAGMVGLARGFAAAQHNVARDVAEQSMQQPYQAWLRTMFEVNSLRSDLEVLAVAVDDVREQTRDALAALRRYAVHAATCLEACPACRPSSLGPLEEQLPQAGRLQQAVLGRLEQARALIRQSQGMAQRLQSSMDMHVPHLQQANQGALNYW